MKHYTEEEVKLIERTAKHDAYLAVYAWAKGGDKNFIPESGSAAWYAKIKMDGHKEFLNGQNLEYDYATQEIKLKKK